LPALEAPRIFDTRVAPDLEASVLAAGIPFFRSPERAMRIFGHLQRYAQAKAGASQRAPANSIGAERLTGAGTLPEYLGKAILANAGVAVPPGGLATSVEQALEIAERIGWPVVAKAQAADLPHKTEAGGVVIGIDGPEALKAAWGRIQGNVAGARPDLGLDGILIETLSPRGVEIVIGGRNDPAWGPVLLFGLGGIWIEALGDVRLAPASIEKPRVVEELLKLRGAALLHGFRGSQAVDLDALADCICVVGRLLVDHPEILEIDINPVMAFGPGTAPVALDALIVLDA
jgi:acyl-CoA synthetase (NDP forming)